MDVMQPWQSENIAGSAPGCRGATAAVAVQPVVVAVAVAAAAAAAGEPAAAVACRGPAAGLPARGQVRVRLACLLANARRAQPGRQDHPTLPLPASSDKEATAEHPVTDEYQKGCAGEVLALVNMPA